MFALWGRHLSYAVDYPKHKIFFKEGREVHKLFASHWLWCQSGIEKEIQEMVRDAYGYGSDSPGRGKCILLFFNLFNVQTVWFFQIFSIVQKRFCPLESKNTFNLVLFEVWEMMVRQIIITIITNFKHLLLGIFNLHGADGINDQREKISKIDTTDALGDAILTMLTILTTILKTISTTYWQES